MFYFHGDTHGNIINCFRQAESKGVAEGDYLFILGDFGIPFLPTDIKQAEATFDLMAKAPWTWYIILGNHDNYDYWETHSCIPRPNIHVIADIAVQTIDGKRFLMIPRAESSDKQYRIPGYSWWPQENGDVEVDRKFMEWYANDEFDYVLTHDCPEQLLPEYCLRYKMNIYPNAREIFFGDLMNNLDYKYWLHGHMHMTNFVYDNDGGDKLAECIYGILYNEDEIADHFKVFREDKEKWKEKLKIFYA